jgi:hypothetical protein
MKKLTDFQIQRTALRYNLETATIKAVCEVESPNGGFDDENNLIFLFEPHIFYQELCKVVPEVRVIEMMKQHPTILSKKWNRALYPPLIRFTNRKIDWTSTMKLRREVLSVAIIICERLKVKTEIAYLSASWGMFQIMGFNYELAGYPDVVSMVHDYFDGEGKQLKSFTIFLDKRNLLDELQRKDWASFARGYNGPRYAENQYDTKLKLAYEKHSRTHTT